MRQYVTWVAAFAIMVAMDFVYVRYTHAITAHKAIPAANWAAVIICLGGLNIVGYSHDPWLIIPGVLGAWAGTFLAARVGSASAS